MEPAVMTAKAQKCYRCGKRYRGHGNWNVDFIAGLKVGILCPDCQTSEEHIAAEVNLATEDYSGLQDVHMETGNDMVRLIHGLIQTYPTPEVMRAKADLLAGARKDSPASEMVRLMRNLAADMGGCPGSRRT
jgi:hypothetical protein